MKDIVFIKRNSTFENDFEIWTDLPETRIEKLLGVTKIFEYEGSLSVTTDPRTGRENVINAILDIVEEEKYDNE